MDKNPINYFLEGKMNTLKKKYQYIPDTIRELDSIFDLKPTGKPEELDIFMAVNDTIDHLSNYVGCRSAYTRGTTNPDDADLYASNSDPFTMIQNGVFEKIVARCANAVATDSNADATDSNPVATDSNPVATEDPNASFILRLTVKTNEVPVIELDTFDCFEVLINRDVVFKVTNTLPIGHPSNPTSRTLVDCQVKPWAARQQLKRKREEEEKTIE